MEEFNYEELKEATKNFSPDNLIGKGSHGTVYKGILKDGRIVAVKKQSPGLRKLHDNSKLENEIRVLSSLQTSSDHFITLLGTSHDDDSSLNRHAIVMEHMPNGTLHDLLHSTNSSQPLSWTKRVLTALQLAKALRFLHREQPTIVHRDVKSANILFDSGWNARLADFGLATIIPGDSVSRLSQPAGTMGYLDPCYTTPCELSTKNDVFSFGVVLFEIISRTKAIEVTRRPSSLVDWATPLIAQNKFSDICDRNLLLPSNFQGSIKQLIRLAGRCVSSNINRPTMEDIVTEMESTYNYIVRVKFPLWTNIFYVLQNKQQKMILKRRIVCAKEEANSKGNTSKGKMLLREVLGESH
ncbi:serine/threonine-protein kinase-like protein At5g23170 [Impatiens glandulifera]|uniref:serine/threonine-protein kinase-like protein At5g23170 n=1 Tax=Impatiens glandulifera TaxID=253017 RepID=UPI001FB0B94D|nr:serine/threonine-protein kinase-like protein At5g23170 [Impatiens glandulifera]